MSSLWRRLENSWLSWALAGLLGLFGLLGALVWVTQNSVGAPGPQPRAPHVRLLSWGDEAAAANYELRAVRSPALIALARGATLLPTNAQAMPALSPPLNLPAPALTGPTRLAGRPAAWPLAFDLADQWESYDMPGMEKSTSQLLAPAFVSGPSARPGGLIIEYQGGLAGKTITLPGWSWQAWLQAGLPWVLTLDIQSDEQGRINHVLLDAPTPVGALGVELLKNLYQGGQIQPPGPSQGRVVVYFDGRL